MFFRREGTYAFLAVLVALVVAGLLFAGSAWSEDKNGVSKKDPKESRQEKQTQSKETRTQKSNTQSAESAESPAARLAGQNPSAREALQAVAQVQASQDLDGETVDVFGTTDIESLQIDVNNCDVDPGDSITFDVSEDPEDVDFATVIDGVNANIDISSDGDLITVEDIDDPDNPIEFFVEYENDSLDAQTLDVDDELVVETSTIDCGNNNNNNNNRNDRRNRFPPGFFPNNNPFLDQYNDDLSQEEQYLDAQNDLNDEGTDGEFTDGQYDDGGVSAKSGDGVAEASTPGAVASSGGDPDEQAPVSGTPNDIVDEIDTGDQPLPNTKGAPLWVYPMVGAGSLLLLGALIRRMWRAE
jgi:hypothetical protein